MDGKPVTAIRPGIRVVRGPDWASKRQDNGEGFVGTVIFVPKHGSKDHKVTVVWDSGLERRYRAGQDGKYDLRVFDSAPSGIVQSNIVCDGCDENNIKGLRWKCTDCDDFDLCTVCYMNDKHDTGHGFVRINSPNCSALPVPPRTKSKSIAAFGLFPGTEVIRGPHWKWKNDDGGEGQVGKILEVVSWDGRYKRGGVKVQWKTDSSVQEYRVGADGCVDVIYTQKTKATSVGKYYPDHLPLVDVEKPGIIFLKAGDKVRVNLTVKAFRQLQDNVMYGGWQDEMDQCIGELGTIVQILFQGQTCRVQYIDGRIWNVNRVALTRVHSFAPGEAVTVLSEYNVVRDLQEGHGGWNDDMRSALGATGRIEKIDEDGDVYVKIKNNTWILSPVCIKPLENEDLAAKIPAIPTEKPTRQSPDLFAVVNEAMAKLGGHLKEKQRSQAVDIVTIVQAISEGNLETVKEILRQHPDAVTKTFEGKTALQIACYEGKTDIVKLLLENKADPNFKDSEGDSPLHYCVHGKEPDALKELLQCKVDVNMVNNNKQTPLHIAVGVKSPECVKLLIQFKANPSLKDSDGDTPMHDAIKQKDDKSSIISDILRSPFAKFSETNANNFNVLHWATMMNFKLAVEIILEKNPKIVNDQMTDKFGFTALHIAASNDFVEIANVLIIKGSCEVDARDKNKRTPLIICVSQGHERTMELLITVGSNVNAQDNDGNTALHVAQGLGIMPMLKQLQSEESQQTDTKIICALLEAKADVDIKNKQGKTPVDLAVDDKIKQFMISVSKKAKAASLQSTQRGVGIPSNWEKMSSSEPFKRVPLSPDSGGMIKMEYEEVAEKFRKTLKQATILQIERVQNVFCWETYQVTRKRLENKYGGPGCANEKDLFHGTVPKHLNTICKQNLDFRLAGERVGAILGAGSYFARDAKYSDLYASPDADRNKYMFLVKVLCGKWDYGSGDYKRPPPINPNESSDLYDCCVDNVDDPKIFCVFDHNQYYPNYLIKYK